MKSQEIGVTERPRARLEHRQIASAITRRSSTRRVSRAQLRCAARLAVARAQ
jgi:hypothetical protein